MKKKFYYLSLMLGLIFGMVSFTSCGGDDDDDDGPYSKKDIGGVWTGYNDDGSLLFFIALHPDNTTKLGMYQKTEKGYVELSSDEGTYEFNTSNGVITVTFSEDNTTETFTIADQKYSSFTLYIGEIPFYMKRYTGSSDSGKPGSSSSSSDKSEVVKTSALKITRYYDSWNSKTTYSDEVVTVYYKKGYDGSVIQTLYKDSGCSSIIGYFSKNSQSKVGTYSVSTFDYCCTTTSGTSTTISYYFN